MNKRLTQHITSGAPFLLTFRCFYGIHNIVAVSFFGDRQKLARKEKTVISQELLKTMGLLGTLISSETDTLVAAYERHPYPTTATRDQETRLRTLVGHLHALRPEVERLEMVLRARQAHLAEGEERKEANDGVQ